MNFTEYLKNHLILIFELIVLLFIFLLSTLLLPHVSFMMTFSCTVAYIIPRIIYSQSSFNSLLGGLSLLGLATLMTVGAIVNIWQFTELTGGTIVNPILVNTDAHKYYNAAIDLYNGIDNPGRVAYYGYPIIINTIWKFTGINVIVPIVVNIFFTLTSIVTSAFISTRLIGDNACKKYIGNLALILTGACCYYLGSGMIILKDPSIFLGVALCAYSLIPIYKTNLRKVDILLFIIGVLLLSLNRVAIIYSVAFGLILFTIFSKDRKLKASFLLLFILFIGTIIGNYFASYGVSHQLKIVEGEILSQEYITTPQQQPLLRIIGDYFNYPAWQKALLLPVTAVTQYLIPFPWNFIRDTPFGYSQILSHIAYPWYCVGGIIIFYYLFLWLRRESGLLWWSFWALVCYLIPAYVFAGSVSRYFLPFLPLFVPLAITVILKLRAGLYRKYFAIFTCIYVTLLVVTLLVCYNLQNAAL